MLSNRIAAALKARNIHYGWVVAATTFLTMLATAGAMGSAGVLIQPLQQEFGWSTASISSAMAVRLALFGLLGPFVAAFMNQFGIRNVVMTALLLIAVPYLLCLWAQHQWADPDALDFDLRRLQYRGSECGGPAGHGRYFRLRRHPVRRLAV